MTRIVATSAVLVLTLGVALPAGATHEPPQPWPEHGRIYLMAAETDHAYWSVDPADPELSSSRLVQRCGILESWRVTQRQKPCFYGVSGTERFYTTWFWPGSLFETPPTWSPQAPLRFHIEMDVEALAAYDVSLVLQAGVAQWESGPATEVAPGVFEGVLPGGSPLGADGAVIFGVRVRTSSDRLIRDLKLRGGSWIELPQPWASKAVTDLRAEDTHAPAPSTFETSTRALGFNDDEWSAWTFSGDIEQTRTFDLEIERDAVAVVAWVEAYDSAFAQDVLQGKPADTRKITDGVAVRMLRDGEEVQRSAGPYIAQGTSALALTSLGAGPVTLEVEGLRQQDPPLEYDVHLVVTHGERTLESMRWLATGNYMLRLPAIANCPGPIEPIPVTPEVRSFLVDLDWETEALGGPAWTLGYDVPTVGAVPCGEEAGGDWVRFTMPGEDVWYVGATPAQHGLFVSAFDTTFEFEVRYTYTAPPNEHE
jgi:hypothetical protein